MSAAERGGPQELVHLHRFLPFHHDIVRIDWLIIFTVALVDHITFHCDIFHFEHRILLVAASGHMQARPITSYLLLTTLRRLMLMEESRVSF